jgi:D-cysteine desulfhydrase
MPVKEPARVTLASLPTPLLPLERLGRELGGASLWIKRDDLTGLELSGNKVRKLEYIAAEALAGGIDTLVTEGTCQSNHCRATAAVCARLGLHCTLLLRPPPPGLPQGNHLLDVLFGAQIRSFEREEFVGRRDLIVEEVLNDLRAAGRRPRFIPMGASEPLGCWGYIRAVAELAEQLAAAGLSDCDVVTAVSSGGTCAGLLLGKQLYGLDSLRLWAVPVSDDANWHAHEVVALCRATIERYGLPVSLRDSDLEFIEGYVGQGYAVPYGRALRVLRMLARTEGIVLDPVYTAKAFCAVVEGVESGRFGRERPLIFIHTGGLFSDFAWPETLSSARETNGGG